MAMEEYAASINNNLQGCVIPAAGQSNKQNPKHMIAMRLHIPEGSVLPFDFLEVHKHANENRYTVFLVVNNKALQIEDGDLFPSDTLITQLRLLEKGDAK